MANEQERTKSIQEDEISLKELILKIKEWRQHLWSKKWIIIVAGIVGGLLGLGYSLVKKPFYIATTTFVLENGEKSGGLGQYAGLASMVGLDLGSGGGGIFQGDNILELYKSRTMLEKTLMSPINNASEQSLIERYLEINGMREKWKEKTQFTNLWFKVGEVLSQMTDSKQRRLKDSIVSEIADELKRTALAVTKPDKKLSIIKVDVKSTDEVFAKRFNEELVKNVNDFYVQTKTKKSLENVAILKHKADSVKAVMNGAIFDAVAIADATPNANPTRQVQRIAPMQKAQFSAETNKAILAEMVKNLEMSRISLMKETPLIQVVDGPIYPLFKEKLTPIKAGIISALIFSIGSIFIIIFSAIYRKISS